MFDSKEPNPRYEAVSQSLNVIFHSPAQMFVTVFLPRVKHLYANSFACYPAKIKLRLLRQHWILEPDHTQWRLK